MPLGSKTPAKKTGEMNRFGHAGILNDREPAKISKYQHPALHTPVHPNGHAFVG
jgi:hypothetical protein